MRESVIERVSATHGPEGRADTLINANKNNLIFDINCFLTSLFISPAIVIFPRV